MKTTPVTNIDSQCVTNNNNNNNYNTSCLNGDIIPSTLSNSPSNRDINTNGNANTTGALDRESRRRLAKERAMAQMKQQQRSFEVCRSK